MLFNRNVLIGSAVVAGVVVIAKAVSKGEGNILRGAVKGVMKAVMTATDKLVEGAASLKENLEDMAAEARSEMASAGESKIVEVKDPTNHAAVH